jgi:hypothetical protein
MKKHLTEVLGSIEKMAGMAMYSTVISCAPVSWSLGIDL